MKDKARENRIRLHAEISGILAAAKHVVDETLLPEKVDVQKARVIDPSIETVTVIQLLNFLIVTRGDGFFSSHDLYRKHVKGFIRLMTDHPHDLINQIAGLARMYYQKNTGSPKSVFREEVKRSLKYAMLIVEKNITDEPVDGTVLGRELESYPLESKVIYAFCLFLKNVRRIVGPAGEKEYVDYLNLVAALVERFPDEVMDAFKNLSRLLA